jgi:hypothetical protein
LRIKASKVTEEILTSRQRRLGILSIGMSSIFRVLNLLPGFEDKVVKPDLEAMLPGFLEKLKKEKEQEGSSKEGKLSDVD